MSLAASLSFVRVLPQGFRDHKHLPSFLSKTASSPTPNDNGEQLLTRLLVSHGLNERRSFIRQIFSKASRAKPVRCCGASTEPKSLTSPGQMQSQFVAPSVCLRAGRLEASSFNRIRK